MSNTYDMAINRDLNSFLANYSGKIGGMLVLKKYATGSVLSKIPDMSKRKLSPKQLEANELMGDANYYAKFIIADPKRKAAAAKKLGVHMNRVYHRLVADFILKGGDKSKLLTFDGKPPKNT